MISVPIAESEPWLPFGSAQGLAWFDFVHQPDPVYWSGRYRMGQSGPVHDVALGLKDRLSAQTKLREIVAEAERESMGLLDPKSQRQAAAESLKRLIDFYEADLTGRCLDRQHVQNTCYRVRRTAGRLRWHRLADIRPDTFVTFRAKLKIFVGVWKEYGISCQAFCRWLVATGRLAASPLANLPRIEIRGEKVRTARAFAMSELQRLCEVAPARAWIYQVLAYTGMRVAEVRHLEWPSVDLERGCLNLNSADRRGVAPAKEMRQWWLHEHDDVPAHSPGR